jgi:cell filamentation protein
VKKSIGKYSVSTATGDTLTNLRGLTDPLAIAEAETAGFIYAEVLLREELTDATVFDLKYLYRIHKLGLDELYPFAGKLRDENMSKDDFPFPGAHYLPEKMLEFEEHFLQRYDKRVKDDSQWIDMVATIHAELLYLHPFREGNGRTARILVDLMAQQRGREKFNFELLTGEHLKTYIAAVQAALGENYEPMKNLFKMIS